MNEKQKTETVEVQDELISDVFAAFELPVSYLSGIQEMQFRLSRFFPEEITTKLKWVKPSDFQLNIRFLGFVPVSFIEYAYDCLAKTSLELGIIESGRGRLSTIHDSRGLPRVITLALDDPSSEIENFRQTYSEMLRSGGYTGTTTDSVPHITLARADENTGPFMKYIETFEETIESIKFSGVSLNRRKDPDGTFETLKVFRLDDELLKRDISDILPDFIPDTVSSELIEDEISSINPLLTSFTFEQEKIDSWVEKNLIGAATAVMPGKPMEDSVSYEENMREREEMKSINDNSAVRRTSDEISNMGGKKSFSRDNRQPRDNHGRTRDRNYKKTHTGDSADSKSLQSQGGGIRRPTSRTHRNRDSYKKNTERAPRTDSVKDNDHGKEKR
ncbi:MAG: hypothetical protein JXR95_13705 [Deltaproteobacteria bacterium]|nr:hypothetical protein [Deltaproteobacteria bacterium]